MSGYVGPVAKGITFDAQRDPMFQDDRGDGWVPLATYDERMAELAFARARLEQLEWTLRTIRDRITRHESLLLTNHGAVLLHMVDNALAAAPAAPTTEAAA